MFGKQQVGGRDAAAVQEVGPAQTGNPRSVSAFCEAPTYAIQYVDDEGRSHVTLAHRIGGIWHLPPNGENYSSTLRPLNKDSWLAKGLERKLNVLESSESSSSPVIPEDAGDIGG